MDAGLRRYDQMMKRDDILMEARIDSGSPYPVMADVRTGNRYEALPVIVLSHGFLGYKRWGFLPYLSRRIAEAGFHVVTMSFSMSGVDETTGLFARPEAFAENTVSRELEDVRSVCEYMRGSSFPLEKLDNRWGFFGYSRGASISILLAPDIDEVRSLVTWSTPSRLDRYTERRKRQWRRDGALVFRDNRSPVPLELGYGYYEDIDRNRKRYDLIHGASRLRVPHLMVHGERDAAVTLNEAKELLTVARFEDTRLEVITGCGHAFGVTHPMRKTTASLERAVDLTVQWFERTLRRH
jgi:dienelactone hydrolase